MQPKRRKVLGPTASQKVYEAVRDAISSDQFKVGERLTEDALARRFQVSRTPVRDAMQRLASDGFVVFTAHSGALIRGWSAREVRDIFEIRANLESMACRLAARRATRADVEWLETLRLEWESALIREPRDVALISERNRAFHAGIFSISGNDRLETMCLQLMDLGFLSRSFSKFDQDDINRSKQDHASLVQAIHAGDGGWAEALMKAHILAATSVFTGTELPG